MHEHVVCDSGTTVWSAWDVNWPACVCVDSYDCVCVCKLMCA